MRTLGFLLLASFVTGALAQGSPSERYENPVDGRTYVAPGGWQRYTPQVGRERPALEKVRLDHVRFLSSDSEIGSNVGIDALVGYIEQIKKHAAEVFGSSKAGAVLVQVNSAPESQDIQLASSGEIDSLSMGVFYDRLVKMERLKVRNGPIGFLLQISVAP